MDSLYSLLFLALAGGAAWYAWQRSQRRKHHVLENLSGPPSRSFLKSELTCSLVVYSPLNPSHTGSLGEMYNRHAMPFQKDVALNYGSVVKLRGLFNVRSIRNLRDESYLKCLQRPIVFISDPAALHTMLIKEEHIFEESRSFILYVILAWSIGHLIMFCIEGTCSYLGLVCWRLWVREKSSLFTFIYLMKPPSKVTNTASSVKS